MTDTQNFRLSYWHMEVARLIGEGLPNREIKKIIAIGDSRLSVLRANPLIKRAADKYRSQHEDKYKKALDLFANNAETVAQEVVNIVKNPLVGSDAKLKAAEMVLEHAARTSAEGQPKQGELVFEQMLRVTKRGDLDSMTTNMSDNLPTGLNTGEALTQLAQDAGPDGQQDSFPLDEDSTSQTPNGLASWVNYA